MIGTGDFNDDGRSDILWQNASTGQVSIWEMNGQHPIGGGPVGPNPGPGWKAIGTGDFNDDGYSDILWQNTSTGQVSIWEMDGNTGSAAGPVSSNPGPSWKALGTGDFNDDGHSDILWRNANGQVAIWEMSGINVDRRRPDRIQSWTRAWSCGRNRRLQSRRPFRHPVAERERSGVDLGNERDQRDRRWAGQPQSWAQLARGLKSTAT